MIIPFNITDENKTYWRKINGWASLSGKQQPGKTQRPIEIGPFLKSNILWKTISS